MLAPVEVSVITISITVDILYQVVIEAVDETGAVLPEAISPGASADLTKDFTTGFCITFSRCQPFYVFLIFLFKFFSVFLEPVPQKSLFILV
jgi:hypothetical protein